MKNRTFLCTWKIKNYSRTSCFAENVGIFSDAFVIESLGNTAVSLLLIPGLKTTNEMRCILRVFQSPERLENSTFNYKFTLLSPKNTIFKSSEYFSRTFRKGCEGVAQNLIERNDLMREISYWSQDTLTIQCLIEWEPDLMNVPPIENVFTGCEWETEVFRDSVFIWSFKISDFQEWSASREADIANRSFRVIFRYIEDELKIYFSPKIYFVSSVYTFLSKISLLDETDSEMITKEVSKFFIRQDEVKELPHSFSKQDLQDARCFLVKELRFKLVFSNVCSLGKMRYYGDNCESDKNSELITTEVESLSCRKWNKGTERVDGLLYLQHDLRKLLADKKFTDVKLRADNELLSAHKVLLAARSTVFSAMFDQDKLENLSGTVDIIDVDAKILKLFLNYLYTGSTEEMDEKIALKLLVVGDQYKVLPLVKKCSTFLKSALSLTNVCNILLTADMVNSQSLKSSSIEYIVEKKTKILVSPEWKQLLKMNNALATDVLVNISKNFEDSYSGSLNETTPGSSKEAPLLARKLKELHLEAGNSKKDQFEAGSSKGVQLDAGSSNEISERSQEPSEVPEPEGRQA